MPMDLELERLREERLKEMKEKQGFVDIRSVVDVRDSGIVRNKEVATQEDGIEFYGFGALLDSKAQKELSQISGGLHGTEKADRIESIIMRMSEQGQLRGRKVTIELIYKLHDVVSKQYESGSKSSMKFSRKEAEDSESDTDSD